MGIWAAIASAVTLFAVGVMLALVSTGGGYR